MGGKISIDSATLMNKGLEVIEAHHLFGVAYDRIDVVVHTQSIVHSMIQLNDGASLAHLGYPDMRVPISFALHHPDRADVPVAPLDLAALGSLDFEEPDPETFACLRLAREAGIAAGTDAVMMSSASYPQLDPDEPAAFSAPIIGGLLRDRLGFDGIVISDDLGNAVAVSGRPAGQRAVDFLAAGGDLVLTVNVADAGPMTAAVVQRAQGDPAFASRLDEAALRVLRSKQEAGLLVC